MSSAELHSLMSQLQHGDEYQSEYETNIGIPQRNRMTGSWEDTEAPGVRIPVPAGQSLPHVPIYKAEKKLTDAAGNLIPHFPYYITTYGDLDYSKYTDKVDVQNMLEYEMASTRALLAKLYNQIHKLKKSDTTQHEKHHPTKAGNYLDADFPPTVKYVAINPNYNGNDVKSAKPNKAKTPAQIEKNKAFFAKKKAERQSRAIQAARQP